jgi:hypothetical protein
VEEEEVVLGSNSDNEESHETVGKRGSKQITDTVRVEEFCT